MGKLRAVRGATTLDADTPLQVRTRVQALVSTLLDSNELAVDELVSVLFTVTPDIHSAFPAAAARELGVFDDVPLMGAVEQDVAGALARCVRVMLHVDLAIERPLRPAYLEGAVALRPDLVR